MGPMDEEGVAMEDVAADAAEDVVDTLPHQLGENYNPQRSTLEIHTSTMRTSSNVGLMVPI